MSRSRGRWVRQVGLRLRRWSRVRLLRSGPHADDTLRITGKLDLNVPPFVKMDYDNESRRLVLNIEDRDIKQQKEMWGAFATSSPQEALDYAQDR